MGVKVIYYDGAINEAKGISWIIYHKAKGWRKRKGAYVLYGKWRMSIGAEFPINSVAHIYKQP